MSTPTAAAATAAITDQTSSWSQGDWALALLPKFSAGIAIPCAIFTVFEILHGSKRKGSGVVKRSLLGMTLIDLCSSSAWFTSSWAVPTGTFPLSYGNQTSCNFQGFLLQLAIGAPLYNCTLALYFLLMLKYRWTEKRLLTLERWIHLAILGFSFGTATLFLPLGFYNPTGQVCWIIGDPINCAGSSLHSTDVPCNRGNHAWIIGIASFYAPLWLCICLCIISMTVIYFHVKKIRRRMNRYSIGNFQAHTPGRSSNDSSRVATQAILYTLAFIITWTPSTLWSISRWFNWSHLALDLAAAFFEPLQAFWNLLVFARTRSSTRRKLWNFFSYLFPCVIKSEGISFLHTSSTYSDPRTRSHSHNRSQQSKRNNSQPRTEDQEPEFHIERIHDYEEALDTMEKTDIATQEDSAPMRSGTTDRCSKESADDIDVGEGYPYKVAAVEIQSGSERVNSNPEARKDSSWLLNDISFSEIENGLEYSSDEPYIIPIRPIKDILVSNENETIIRKECLANNRSRSTVRFSAENEV